VLSNLTPNAAQTQSIEMNWRDGEPNAKILQHSVALFSGVSTTQPRHRSENRV